MRATSSKSTPIISIINLGCGGQGIRQTCAWDVHVLRWAHTAPIHSTLLVRRNHIRHERRKLNGTSDSMLFLIKLLFVFNFEKAHTICIPIYILGAISPLSRSIYLDIDISVWQSIFLRKKKMQRLRKRCHTIDTKCNFQGEACSINIEKCFSTVRANYSNCSENAPIAINESCGVNVKL